MSEEIEHKDFEVVVQLIVTAPTEDEALKACTRSGLVVGALIGEALIDSVTVCE